MKVLSPKLFIRIGVLAALLSIGANLYFGIRFWSHASNQARLEARFLTIEAELERRRRADPLEPVECDIANGLGDARDRPCRTYIWRLLRSPQQFDGKWVSVEGRYEHAFEHSALYDIKDHPLRGSAQVTEQNHFAIWITNNQGIDSEARIRFVGRYRPGPSGHFGLYGGELDEAKSNLHSGGTEQ